MIPQVNNPIRLGAIVATPAALKFLEENSNGLTPRAAIQWLLLKHQRGHWGQISDDDKRANDYAREHGGRILSSYNLGDGKVWIITEADRSATTILLPEEY